jgi:hypothetical protein
LNWPKRVLPDSLHCLISNTDRHWHSWLPIMKSKAKDFFETTDTEQGRACPSIVSFLECMFPHPFKVFSAVVQLPPCMACDKAGCLAYYCLITSASPAAVASLAGIEHQYPAAVQPRSGGSSSSSDPQQARSGHWWWPQPAQEGRWHAPQPL